MANPLDRVNGPINKAGRDVNVIDQQVPVTVGVGSTIFEILLWVCGILPGLIFLFMKIGAKNYFLQLSQKMQAEASQIDNYLVQRGEILKNVAGLVQKAIGVDTDIMKSVAAYRGGMSPDANRNEVQNNINAGFASLVPHLEAYPELRSHQAIASAMQQNDYLQREITAARSLYNDTILQWNRDIFSWPTKQIVAARAGYTTEIPFIASAEQKATASSTFF